MRVGLYGRLFSDKYIENVEKLLNRLQEEVDELKIYEPFFHYLRPIIDIPQNVSFFTNSGEIVGSVDYLLSIGGDGTFLDASTYVKNSGIPILGINTGRLGFLTSLSIQEFSDFMDDFKNERFIVESRTVLKLETDQSIFKNADFALNEITIHKKDTSSMIVIHAYLDDEYLNSYWADGLIVSTPTGSTAYSLSCGGPIVIPGSENLLITPVAPHNLNVRPIVFPDDKKLKLVMEGRSKYFLISLDSRSETIDSSSEIVISKNNFKINIIKSPSETFLKTIRNKLNWGLDKRNLLKQE